MVAEEIRSGIGGELRMGLLAKYYLAQPTGLPKASRLFEACLRMIERGYWRTGDKIPAELYLTDNLPVSLATVQSALRRLSDEGLLIRRRKAGSFIADPGRVERELYFFRFHGDQDQQYLSLTGIHLEFEKIYSDGYWSGFLGNKSSYIRAERILDIGGEFLVFTEMILANPVFDALLDIPIAELLDVNFRSVFIDRLGLKFTRSDRRISFTRLTSKQAKILGCDYALPALQYDIRQYTLRDEPLFFMRAVIPQNDRSLQIAGVDM